MKQLCVVLNQNILTLSSVLILLNCPHYWTLFVFLYPRLVHFVHRPHQSIWKRRWRWLYVRHLQTPLFSFFHRRKKTNFQDTLLLELFSKGFTLMSVYRRFSVDDGQRRQRRFKKCAVSNENALVWMGTLKTMNN